MTDEAFQYQAVIDDQDGQPLEVTEHMVESTDILRLPDGLIHCLDAYQSHYIEVLQADYRNKVYQLRIKGQVVYVKLRDPVEARVHAMGFDLNRNHARQKHVASPMPGLVLKVLVADGDRVEQGQPVIVLEAMKMENVLTAPSDGTITHVLVREKHNVDKGQVLIEIE